MQVISSIEELRTILSKTEGTIGFVPTMGALHDGHISLVAKAKDENDVCVCSVFVNPTQFDNELDLQKYPRTLDADAALLKKNNCDIVFSPSNTEMYPSIPKLSFNFGALETVLEGAYRQGHFNGVGLVVSKLFHIVQPDKAYFGQKDLQQVAIIKQLVKDLSFQIKVISCPTIREPNGLAKSSRNERLTKNGKQTAGVIYKALLLAQNLLQGGSTLADSLLQVNQFFDKYPDFTVEYFTVCAFDTLEPINSYTPDQKTAICTAVYYENVRLIDNVLF